MEAYDGLYGRPDILGLNMNEFGQPLLTVSASPSPHTRPQHLLIVDKLEYGQGCGWSENIAKNAAAYMVNVALGLF
jgi:hypothetical protein